jgi:Flp pilus assembly protein TadD
MPRNPRSEMKEAQFQEAIRGLDFETGIVVVVEPLPGEDPQQHLAEGLDKLEHNRLTGALTAIVKGVRADPASADGYNTLGLSLQAKGKMDHALAAYRTALALEPDFADAQYNLAAALSRMGRRAEAIAEMSRLLELDPANAEAHERLAIWSYYEGDYDAAWQHTHAARDLGGDVPPQFLALLESEMPDPG